MPPKEPAVHFWPVKSNSSAYMSGVFFMFFLFSSFLACVPSFWDKSIQIHSLGDWLFCLLTRQLTLQSTSTKSLGSTKKKPNVQPEPETVCEFSWMYFPFRELERTCYIWYLEWNLVYAINYNLCGIHVEYFRKSRFVEYYNKLSWRLSNFILKVDQDGYISEWSV